MPATATAVQTSDEPILLRQDAGGIATVTLNRPKQYNSLSEELLTELQSTLDAIGKDESVRVVVIAGAGSAFCAGHDLKQMRATPRKVYYDKLFAQCSNVMMKLLRLPQPVIARVHGIATAAGCQLVAQCDLAVASDAARFAVSGINVGLFCSTPSVSLGRNVSRKEAMEMLLTGDFISAQQALERALVNRVVAPDQLDAEVAQLVDSILAKPGAAIAMGKDLFYRQREMGLEAAYQLANQTMAVNMMESCAQEGVAAFTEKRKPDWSR